MKNDDSMRATQQVVAISYVVKLSTRVNIEIFAVLIAFAVSWDRKLKKDNVKQLHLFSIDHNGQQHHALLVFVVLENQHVQLINNC